MASCFLIDHLFLNFKNDKIVHDSDKFYTMFMERKLHWEKRSNNYEISYSNK